MATELRYNGEGHEILQQARSDDAQANDDSWWWGNLTFTPYNNQRINGQMTIRTNAQLAQQTSLIVVQMWLWGHKEDNWPYFEKSIYIFPAGTNELFAAANLEC